ncbi:hypothetical protein BpHYR1_043017 [Brachionus plicatilis]|uniref:Uncharacterized protein n=1 Tax=Brachionus plicatilis TaxID=10195 RepID=A0A3M7QLU1_BRAPC|nr:hypothetical protein BpHYR1_043017 [Brachionus plicatilis]
MKIIKNLNMSKASKVVQKFKAIFLVISSHIHKKKYLFSLGNRIKVQLSRLNFVAFLNFTIPDHSKIHNFGIQTDYGMNGFRISALLSFFLSLSQ